MSENNFLNYISSFVAGGLVVVGLAYMADSCTSNCNYNKKSVSSKKTLPAKTTSRQKPSSIDITIYLTPSAKLSHKQSLLDSIDNVLKESQSMGLDYSSPSLDDHKRIQSGEW